MLANSAKNVENTVLTVCDHRPRLPVFQWIHGSKLDCQNAINLVFL